LTEDERSLLRTFAGEWIFGDRLLRQGMASDWRPWWGAGSTVESDASFTDRLLDRGMRPLFQPQDLSNLRADMFLRAAEGMHVPYDQFPAGMERARAIFEAPAKDGPFHRLYNPIGDLVLCTVSSGYASYGARVADLEGARRAAVLATEMRSRKLETAAIPAALAASTARSPYDNAPFDWDAQEQAIVFTGLEPSQRRRHFFKY